MNKEIRFVESLDAKRRLALQEVRVCGNKMRRTSEGSWTVSCKSRVRSDCSHVVLYSGPFSPDLNPQLSLGLSLALNPKLNSALTRFQVQKCVMRSAKVQRKEILIFGTDAFPDQAT